MEKTEAFNLYQDLFDGTEINREFWQLPIEGESSFLGRTQLRLGGFPEFEGGFPVVANSIASLRLDTFNPVLLGQPGAEPSFYGQEIISKETFSRGSGLGIEATVRLKEGAPAGLVATLFSFVFDDADNKRDEIDVELLSAQPQKLLTNVFDDDPIPNVAGDKQLISPANFDFTEFHTYRIEWLPDKVRWLVDGQVIREEFDTVPDEPTSVRLNFWAAKSDFSEAYNGALAPATQQEDNATYFYEVDSFQVDKLAKTVFEEDGQNRINRFAFDFTAFDTNRATINLGEEVGRLANAVFDNLIGLYEVVDEQGGIDTNGDGNADLLPNQAGYAKAAIERRISNFQVRSGVSNTTTAEFGDVLLEGGKYYAPFVIANGGSLGFDEFIAAEEAEGSAFNNAATVMEDAVAYFSYLGANPDGAQHLRSLGNNIFGFEDLPSNLGMSDNDFNDAIVQFQII